jgi:hypothetical protein
MNMLVCVCPNSSNKRLFYEDGMGITTLKIIDYTNDGRAKFRGWRGILRGNRYLENMQIF